MIDVRACRLAAAVLVLFVAGRADAKAKSPHIAGTCSGKQEGNTSTVSYNLRIKKKPYVLATDVARDIVADTSTQTTVLTRGKTTALRFVLASSGSGTTLQATFGKGFKGIHEIDVAPDGDAFRAVVDGRRTVLFPAGADPSSVAFEDGQPAPKLHVRRDVKKSLSALAKVGAPQCFLDYAGVSSSAAIQPEESVSQCLLGFGNSVRERIQPEDSLEPPCQKDDLGTCDPFPGCNACKACCGARAGECGETATVAAAVTGPFGFIVAGAVCIKNTDDCSDACEKEGNACCPKRCSDRCTGPKEWVCCGQISGSNSGICPAEQCCGTQDDPHCCSADQQCRRPGPGRAICCDQGDGDPCFNDRTCCPAAAPRCVSGANGPTCCPDGQSACGVDANDNDLCCATGSCCKANGIATCCGPGQMCLPDGECCAPGDVCGGTCCPSHVCLNNSTCCAPPNSFVCGGQCCPALGTTCCNGQCCAGACVAGVCCPNNRVCGQNCCAPNNYCANAQTGLCVACPAGNEPCVGSENGGPACCPSAIQCCTTGCCADGLECCTTVGETTPTCHTTCVR